MPLQRDAQHTLSSTAKEDEDDHEKEEHDLIPPHIIGNRGSALEADVFSILRHSPYVVRSFEFAVADGAIVCTEDFEFLPADSFAERFHKVADTVPELLNLIDPAKPTTPHRLVPFDVKSTVSRFAGQQLFHTTLAQRRHVAFYIGICAADPSYVEVIPNPRQMDAADDFNAEEDPDPEDRQMAVNVTRVSKLQPPGYTLDPCGGPYRMPIAYLTEAIRRIRAKVMFGQPYTNPWTQVTFDEWTIYTTHTSRGLRPKMTSQHFTGYKAVWHIYHAIRHSPTASQMKFDFVGLQPHLADFKIVLTNHLVSGSPSTTPSVRQYFVQHKLESHDRTRSSLLTNVAIARGQGEARRWYFTAFQRFDYLFYQFTFSNRPNPHVHYEFFFIPEFELPDSFFETEVEEASFERPNFQQYRIVMDREGLWVARMLDIIRRNPQPRQPTARPLRRERLPTNRLAPPQPQKGRKPRDRQPQITQGRSLYKDVMVRSHRQLFDAVMTTCANRFSGLLVPLATEHPMADFFYCRYQWTLEERHRYFLTGQPPKTLSQLPAETPGICLVYYAKDMECDSHGPTLTAPQFRRLDSCGENRLILWSLWGSDEPRRSTPLAVIPSSDLGPTETQRRLFRTALETRKIDSFTHKMPTLSGLLKSGHYTADYMVGCFGPLYYDMDPCDAVLELLDRFVVPGTLEHPLGCPRSTADFHYPLRRLHQRLHQGYLEAYTAWDWGSEDEG